MAILDGHNAQVDFTSNQPPGLLLVTKVRRWRFSMLSSSSEVTRFKSSYQSWWPNHYGARLELDGFIDQDVNPGLLSIPIYNNRITVTVKPNRAEPLKNVKILGAWVERVDWMAAIDEANSFYAVVRNLGAVELNWS